MEFFQFAGEMGSTAVPAVVRRALAANILDAMNYIAQSPSHKCQRRGRRWLRPGGRAPPDFLQRFDAAELRADFGCRV
jgi:hypothetical protein